jgi:hypothetical protein
VSFAEARHSAGGQSSADWSHRDAFTKRESASEEMWIREEEKRKCVTVNHPERQSLTAAGCSSFRRS